MTQQITLFVPDHVSPHDAAGAVAQVTGYMHIGYDPNPVPFAPREESGEELENPTPEEPGDMP